MAEKVTKCPFSLFLFTTTALTFTKYLQSSRQKNRKVNNGILPPKPMFNVVFVLGGPGAGKGTQCTLLSERHPKNWTHLSAGDLLRAERKSGSKLADLINDRISKGQIVPAEITVDLLSNAMEEAYERNDKNVNFLIDGFPRSEDNVTVWNERMTATSNLKFILFLDCPQDVMTGRLLERGKTSGRNDDNLETIQKRFRTFQEESMPIVKMYEEKDEKIVKYVVADRGQEDVYKEIESLFNGF